MNQQIWHLLRCPSCGEKLAPVPAASLAPVSFSDAWGETTGDVRCASGEHSFPLLGEIPLLMTDPASWRSRWSEGMGLFVNQMTASERQLLVELFEQDLRPRGKNRVTQVAQGLARHREEVVHLMQRLGVHATFERPPPSEGTERADRQRFSPETYLTLIHRDYGWAPEVDEVGVSWARLLRVLPGDFRLGSCVVLGAGTGRLAWQLAAQFGDGAPVLALDINPLPFIVTALLQCGEQVSLTELPAHPRRSSLAALTRPLRCPLPSAPALQLLFADGVDPPLARGALQTVVTPWFVDQVPPDAASIPPLVFDLLVDGGSFICTGPFLYDAGLTKPSLRYCADEFIEMVESAGFEITMASYETEPYAASPLSTQGRTEHVLYMHARKVASKAQRTHQPAFLRRGPGTHLPVEAMPGLAGRHFEPQQVSDVAALIDGQRSVLDITNILVERGVLADDGAADAAVIACIQVLRQQLGKHD